MSSRRVFELVDYIHQALAEEEQGMTPFGEKQLICVVEFLQLPSLPGFFEMEGTCSSRLSGETFSRINTN